MVVRSGASSATVLHFIQSLMEHNFCVSKAKKDNQSKGVKKSTAKNQKKHKCHLCKYATSRKGHLNEHIRIHIREKPFECEICAKAFTRRSNLNSHMRIHATEYPFHCEKCRRGFKHDVNKIEHEKQCQHRQFECMECKYITDNLPNFKRHMLIHSREKPFKCRVCSKIFSLKSNLNSHLRTHVKQLPFDCFKCGQRFADENGKQSHEDHCKRRRFECHICPHKSFTKSLLKRHMQRQHTDEKPFQCKVCDKKLVSKGDLKKHLDIHAKPRPNRCIKCCRRFANEEDKNVHQGHCKRRHYECYICQFSVRSSMQLRSHMCNHHTGERPFACKWCDTRFSLQSNDNLHMNRVHRQKN